MINSTMDVTDGKLGEIEVAIRGSYTPAERGRREDGLQMDPDYDACIEDIGATYKGKPYELTASGMEKAEEILTEIANDGDGDGDGDRDD